MRQLLEGVAGVDKAGIKINRNAADLLKNSVVVQFEAGRTSVDAITKAINEHWDIAWYACPCGKTSPTPAEC